MKRVPLSVSGSRRNDEKQKRWSGGVTQEDHRGPVVLVPVSLRRLGWTGACWNRRVDVSRTVSSARQSTDLLIWWGHKSVEGPEDRVLQTKSGPRCPLEQNVATFLRGPHTTFTKGVKKANRHPHL